MYNVKFGTKFTFLMIYFTLLYIKVKQENRCKYDLYNVGKKAQQISNGIKIH